MRILLKALVVLGLPFAVSLAHAEQGFYLGFNVGQATYDLALDDFAIFDDGSIVSASLDDSDTSFGFNLGYQLTENFSLEVGYVDLGEFTLDAVSDGSGFLYFPGNVDMAFETTGVTLALKLQAPVNEAISLYGKFGVLSYEVDFSFSNSGVSGSDTVDDSNDTFYGLGASFAVGNNTSLNIDYVLYSLDDLDVDVASVGLEFKL